MSRDGSGNYTIPNTFTSGTTIVSDDVDANFSDIATALTASIAKDGQTTPSANLPMGNFRHTGVGAAAARTDYARAGETQATLAYTWATVGGTADVITLTTTFAPAAYAAGQTIRFAASGNNTTTVTVNWNSLGAKALKTQGAVALSANDLISGRIYMATYDGTDFRLHGAVPSEGFAASGSITASGYTQNTSRLLGRTTASAGAIEEITVGSPLTFTGGALDIDTSALVPTGAITTSGLTMATARIIGRTTAATGAPEEITIGTGLTFSGGSLSVSSTGGITTISSGSLTGSAVTITSIAATYAYLLLQLTGASGTTTGRLLVRVSTNNGSSYDSTVANYKGYFFDNDNTTPRIKSTTLASLVDQGDDSDANSPAAASSWTTTTRIMGYQTGPHMIYETMALASGIDSRMNKGIYTGSTSAIDAIQISLDAGTFDAGTYALYGIS